MEVCFVTPYSPREITGVSRFLEDLTQNLKTQDIDSIVITRLVKPTAETSAQMIEIDCNPISKMKDVYLAICTSMEIWKMRKNITLIHLQTPLPQSAISALTGKLLGIPVITTIHGRYPPLNSFTKKRIYDIMEKITFFSSDALIFVSNSIRQYFNYNKGEVILNGINIEKLFFSYERRKRKRLELGIDENEVVFIYVGRWVAHKGIYNLLDSFKQLISEGKKAKLIFVGSGESDKVTREIKKLNLDKNVLPIGKVDNVEEYLCAADVFVLYTSELEGLPLALLEAMACRVVPIATNVSGIPEVITDSENGFLIKEGESEELEQKMSWCVDNIEQVHSIGLNAEKTIRSNYSVDRMADEYIQTYKKILNIKL